ncbi:MAG: recombination protein RecR [Clostridia bacterium]|nr:recombination protein RecR [Clostridia bacterium]
MDFTAAPLERLIEQFEKMPGIGRKTAQRMAFFVLGQPKEEGLAMAKAITDACEKIHKCELCCNLTDGKYCPVCSSPKRSRSLICVVEDAEDLMAIEKTNEYKGTYHVLHGVISPLEGIGPENLTVKELLARIGPDEVSEVIMATNSNIEGEATAMYISKLLKPLGVKVSRLAYGLPVGSDLQYADSVTLTRAIEGRKDL